MQNAWVPPTRGLILYGLGALALLVAFSGAGLGLVPNGFLTYGAAFCTLLGALLHAMRDRNSSRQGSLRLLGLAVVAPLTISAVGLLGERMLVQFGVVAQSAPLDPAATILLTAAVALAVVVACASALPPLIPGPKPGEAVPIVTAWTVTVIDATLVAASLALFLWFARSGVVPMLYRGNVDEIRFALSARPEFSLYSRFIYLGSVALAVRLGLYVAGARYLSGLSAAHTAAVCVPTLIGFVLYASKYLYVYPLGVAFLSYNRFRRPVNLWRPRVITAGIVFVYVMVLVSNLRGLGRLVGNSIGADIFILLPEYRDMAQVVSIADNVGLRADTYGEVVWAAVPNELAGLFGQVRKTSGEDEAYLYKKILGYTFAGGSARIGFMGELYVNSRLLGVGLGIGVLAFVLAFLDRAATTWRWHGFGPLLALALGVQLLWLFQAELPTAMPITYVFAYYLGLLSIVNRLPELGRLSSPGKPVA